MRGLCRLLLGEDRRGHDQGGANIRNFMKVDPPVKKATGSRVSGGRCIVANPKDACTMHRRAGLQLKRSSVRFRVSGLARCIVAVSQGCVFGAVYGSVGSEPLGLPNGEYVSGEGIPDVLLPVPVLLRVGAHSSDAAPAVLRFTGDGEMIF